MNITMAKLLIHEPPLQVLPTLAKEIGLNEAIVLQQLHYWLENQKVGFEQDGFKWIANTYDEWQENFPFWSVSTVKRVFTALEEQGLVISGKFEKSDWNQRKAYRIDYDLLDKTNLTQSSSPNRAVLNRNTETTTENTGVPPIVFEKANKTVDAILHGALSPKAIQDAVTKYFKLTPKWEGNKFNREWMQWAMENNVTPELIERAANKWREDKAFNWRHPDLKAIQEKWLLLIESEPESNFEMPKDGSGFYA